MNGTTHSAGPVAAQGQEDAALAYGVLDGLPCEVNLSGMVLGTDVGATPLAPGVYCFNSDAQLTGTLTLDSQGDPGAVWVFQVGETLTTAAGAEVVMADNGAAGNVFWQVTTSATIGTNTILKGNVISMISVTLNTGAVVDGRVFARTGAVTMDTNTITTEPFVESMQKVRTYGSGLIRVPSPNRSDRTASGSGRAEFSFNVKRDVDGGPVQGYFRYFNPVQRLKFVGDVTKATVLKRRLDGTIKTMVFEGTCRDTVPQCRFAVTVIEVNDERQRLGLTVTGALSEGRSRRDILCSPEEPKCAIRIRE
ncbi:MAG: ice-binding family protein [Candidatus Rokuibacteriota bacterium]